MYNKKLKSKTSYITKWAKKLKAVEFLGGKCTQCSCNDPRVLEFHHISDDKENIISNMSGGSWKKIQNEIDKCILLCSNCHRTEHAKFLLPLKNDAGRHNKSILLEFVGRKECSKCQIQCHTAALTFHHRNPNEKDFSMSSYKIRINSVHDLEQTMIDEINKCDLLCSNCHQIEHISEKFKLYEKEIIEKSKDLENVKGNRKLDRVKILQLYNDGKTMYRISKILNASKSSISYIVHKNKIMGD